MAFSSVLVAKDTLPGGIVMERYTWNGASVTTGTITCDTTVQPEIAEVLYAVPASDGDTAVICALDAGANKVKLTFTSSDTGDVAIFGKAK